MASDAFDLALRLAPPELPARDPARIEISAFQTERDMKARLPRVANASQTAAWADVVKFAGIKAAICVDGRRVRLGGKTS